MIGIQMNYLTLNTLFILQDMKRIHILQILTKCFALVFIFCDSIERVYSKTSGEEELENSKLITDKIELFKLDILNRLGYDRPPNVSHFAQDIEEKRKMIKQYRKYIEEKEAFERKESDQDGMDEDTVTSNTFYSLHYQGGMPDTVKREQWLADNVIRVHFQTKLSHPENDHTKELHVSSAKLRLRVLKGRPENLKDKLSVEKIIRVNAYQILSINSSDDYRRKLLDSFLLDLTQPTFLQFEIKNAVQDWINNKSSNLGIELAADVQDINEVLEIYKTVIKSENSFSNGNNSSDTSPSVDIYAHEKAILKRVKRHTRRRGDCKRGDGETKCCRYPIKISFADIGWDDWIIAPHEYKGYYCAGDCPFRHKMWNTFTGIKALLHLKHPKKVPAPCCVATKLSPFTILHYDDEGKYQFSEYQDLVVEQCKCG